MENTKHICSQVMDKKIGEAVRMLTLAACKYPDSELADAIDKLRVIARQQQEYINQTAMMPVVCISQRELSGTDIDEVYSIERSTIFIDRDGDTYGDVYNRDGKRVGTMLLKHFKTLTD